MENIKKSENKIDTTLIERRKIGEFLTDIAHADVDIDKLESIGSNLVEMGPQVLPLLLKKVRECQDDDLLSKYIFLIEYIDDEEFIAPLIDLLYEQRISDFARLRILATLKYFDVDISDPRFRPILNSLSKSTPNNALRFVGDSEKDEDGLVDFLFEFDTFPRDIKLKFLNDLDELRDERCLSILSVLAESEDEELSRVAIAAIGKIRHASAGRKLVALKQSVTHPARIQNIDKSIRRLQFSNVRVSSKVPPFKVSGSWETFLSPFDASGERSLIVIRDHPGSNDSIRNVIFLLCEIDGVKDCNGAFSMGKSAFNEKMDKIRKERIFEPVSRSYALKILEDALYRNQLSQTPLPPLYLLYKSVLLPEIPSPKNYTPVMPDLILSQDSNALASTKRVLNIKECRGWYLFDIEIFDFAELLVSDDLNYDADMPHRDWALFRSFFENLLWPQREVLCRRLEMTADFISESSNNREKDIEALFRLSHAFRHNPKEMLCRHPFVDSIIKESLSIASKLINKEF